MAYITSPSPTASAAFGWTGVLAQAGRGILDLLAIIAAAGRVANAVEARREPALSDLQILGVGGPLPRAW